MTREDQELIQLLEQAIPELMRSRHIPGFNIAVARRGEAIWEAGFGHADLTERRPMTPDTVFRSGSMGKTYVATAIMQLVEADVIALDGPVTEYVGFPVENPLGERAVTVEDLLTHRSGLSSNVAHSTFRPPPPLAQHLREDFARGQNESFRDEVPKWTEPVGTAFQYSNSGFGLLGLIVETMNPDRLSFGNYVLRHILEPLGMSSTRHPDGNFDDPEQVPDDIRERVGTGYAGWGAINVASPNIYFTDFPCGYILSIPREHIRLLLAYLNGGEYQGVRLLQPETVENMLRPRVDASLFGSRSETVGLAWWLGGISSPTAWFGHAGGHMWGWWTDYRAYPQLDLAIVTATNRWDMAHYSSLSPDIPATVLIEELAAEHVARDEQRTSSSGVSESWSWKRSYALGLDFVAQNQCYLGMDDEISQEIVSQMATKAFGDGAVELDAAGFSAAINDTAHADYRVAGLDAFLNSGKCRMTRAELTAVWVDIGGSGPFPFPVAPALRDLFAAGRTR